MNQIKRRTKKRKHAAAGSLLLCLLLTAMLAAFCWSCGEQKESLPEEDPAADELFEQFVGAWACQVCPLNQPDYYTGYLRLEVQDDRTFSMYDIEAGNPGIAGKFRILSDSRLQMTDLDEIDFDPPWRTMTPDDPQLDYQFRSEKQLRLTYTDEKTGESMTLIFDKVIE